MSEENGIYLSGIKKEFYDKLKDDKIKINGNKTPIKMELFLSFLTIDVKRRKDHLGYCNGWTQLENDDFKLKITGGMVNGEELLDTLQFGTKLSNPYNNYVNPFYLFEILNAEGRHFFVEYYKEDIEELIQKCTSDISYLEASLLLKKEIRNKMVTGFQKLTENK